MLPCFSDLRKVAPLVEDMSEDERNQRDEEGGGTACTSAAKSASPSWCDSPLTTEPQDYTVFQAIGVGCFGAATIFISQHIPCKMHVVLRLVDLEVLSGPQLEDVQSEMKLSQMLHHSNIAGYLCSFVVGQKLWAIQTLMHYGSCADIMHSAQPFRNGFKETVIAHVLRDIINGLDYLHSLGYVHRSIRAKHFLIHKDGVVKLSGLRSIASMISEGARIKALHGHFGGTVDNICWLAPEVLAQDIFGYSFKSDVYSIGIAALELATGEAPFAGLPVTEIMMLKLRGHPPILMKKQDGEKETQLSSQLSKLVDLCVDPDPTRRPSPAKLLSSSLFRPRKRSLSPHFLKELLLPVVPLDTSKLTPSPDPRTGLETQLEALKTEERWSI